jgi:hypothetical protein
LPLDWGEPFARELEEMLRTARRVNFFSACRCAAALAGMFYALTLAIPLRSATFDAATLAASKSLEDKMEILGNKDTQTPAPPVMITENEANSYLKVHSGEFLPPGVKTPSVTAQPEHATVAADVDFDQLARMYPNPNDMGPKILAAMFHGVQHVTVVAKVQPQDTGVFVQIESVVVGNTTVPQWLVDYLIQNVLQPRYHFDLSKPFPYPDHVTMIVLGAGQATFLRGPKVPK